ncbi:MAG: LysR family transcriptional regulator [Bdellovibrionales bacterium]|nr:LysR family transcriptional regulator [Bdellovibrionales bacterium]
MRNYNHLYYFYVVAKLGGVTVAAKQLNTSQSSLSTQLKTLESQIGAALFKKEGRNLTLTSNGQAIYAICRKMFEVASELDSFLAKREHRGQTSFAIGVSPDIERPFVTDVVSRTIQGLKDSHRPVITQVSFPFEKLVARVEMGDLDAIITSQPTHSPSVKTLCELKLAVKAVASPKLGKTFKTIFNDDRVGLVIASQDLRLRWETDEFLLKRKIKKPIAFESNVLGALLRASVDALGVAFLPEVYLQREIDRGAVMVSREPLWTHRLFLSARALSASEPRHHLLSALTRRLEEAVD